MKSLIPESVTNFNGNNRNAKMTAIEDIMEMVSSGEIQDFVVVGIDRGGNGSCWLGCGGMVSGLGMLELGKYLMLKSEENS